MIDSHYMSPEGLAIVRAAAKALGDDLAARRILRDTARRIDLNLGERRVSEQDRRQTVDRRGAITVEIDGKTVIRPRSDLARFDKQPADVTAFIIDEQLRSGAGS